MDELPTDWNALCALVLLLGLRHGFDADHLATINGLTRFNAQAGRSFARWCGALFSLGHGAVVMLIALAVGLAHDRWATPAWLDLTGAWVSIAFLLALGVFNLHAVLAATPGALVQPVGLKGRFLGRFNRAGHPLAVAAVGALFALSFDTVSQSALFALAGVHFGGIAHSLFLGAVFLIGMLVTDALNGLWISRLLARADALAATASRMMGLAIGGVSLLVAAFGGARLALGPGGGPEWVQGGVVVGVIASSYLVARRLARAPRPSLARV
jgi:nickel/cobalt transporter (NiCoT) family protein